MQTTPTLGELFNSRQQTNFSIHVLKFSLKQFRPQYNALGSNYRVCVFFFPEPHAKVYCVRKNFDKSHLVYLIVLVIGGILHQHFERIAWFLPSGVVLKVFYGVVRPNLETYTLFQTEICDCPYPFQIWNWYVTSLCTHSQKWFLLFLGKQCWCGKHSFFLNKIRSAKPERKISPFSDQNHSKTIPWRVTHTCVACIGSIPSRGLVTIYM